MLLALLHPAFADDRIATVHLGVGMPDLLGGGVSLTAFRPLEVEVGGATGILWTTLYARAGGALALYDGRDAGKGWLVEGLALGGYRYLDNAAWTGDFTKHGAELDLAAELTGWVAPHFGLGAQALAGGGFWIASNEDGSSPFYYDVRLALSVGF